MGLVPFTAKIAQDGGLTLDPIAPPHGRSQRTGNDTDDRTYPMADEKSLWYERRIVAANDQPEQNQAVIHVRK